MLIAFANLIRSTVTVKQRLYTLCSCLLLLFIISWVSFVAISGAFAAGLNAHPTKPSLLEARIVVLTRHLHHTEAIQPTFQLDSYSGLCYLIPGTVLRDKPSDHEALVAAMINRPAKALHADNGLLKTEVDSGAYTLVIVADNKFASPMTMGETDSKNFWTISSETKDGPPLAVLFHDVQEVESATFMPVAQPTSETVLDMLQRAHNATVTKPAETPKVEVKPQEQPAVTTPSQPSQPAPQSQQPVPQPNQNSDRANGRPWRQYG